MSIVVFIIPLGEGGLAKIKGDESFRIVIGGIMKVSYIMWAQML